MEKNKMGGTCSTYRGGDVWLQGLVVKPERKRPLGRLKLR